MTACPRRAVQLSPFEKARSRAVDRGTRQPIGALDRSPSRQPNRDVFYSRPSFFTRLMPRSVSLYFQRALRDVLERDGPPSGRVKVSDRLATRVERALGDWISLECIARVYRRTIKLLRAETTSVCRFCERVWHRAAHSSSLSRFDTFGIRAATDKEIYADLSRRPGIDRAGRPLRN